MTANPFEKLKNAGYSTPEQPADAPAAQDAESDGKFPVQDPVTGAVIGRAATKEEADAIKRDYGVSMREAA